MEEEEELLQEVMKRAATTMFMRTKKIGAVNQDLMEAHSEGRVCTKKGRSTGRTQRKSVKAMATNTSSFNAMKKKPPLAERTLEVAEAAMYSDNVSLASFLSF